MIFWDSSAIVPLLVTEPASEAVCEILRSEPAMLVWWATPIECLSAIARREREGGMDQVSADQARQALRALSPAWNEIVASEELREHASRLLLRHPLRSADALQLAAAMVWARGRPRHHSFCTLDGRLAEAARSEGFYLILALP